MVDAKLIQILEARGSEQRGFVGLCLRVFNWWLSASVLGLLLMRGNHLTSPRVRLSGPSRVAGACAATVCQTAPGLVSYGCVIVRRVMVAVVDP
jgi:hypothetical protein